MNALWTDQDAAQATGGQTQGQWKANNVAIDSRSLKAGDLFVALKGPKFDGHEFVGNALAAGAAAAMVSEQTAGMANATLLCVPDTYQGLVDLGIAGRARAQAKIIAVTGSVGKTGSKEALRHVLSAQGIVHASEGSFNNHWGVPLSLARLPPAANFAIFELGMNHAGEIAPLVAQVRPHVALITNIEHVHVEHLGSLEAVADAKAEIFTGLEPGGIAILNRDTPFYERLKAAAPRSWSFGATGQGEAALLEVVTTDTGSHVRAVLLDTEINFTIPQPGQHLVVNALGVLLAAVASGADLKQAASAYATLPSVKGRGTRFEIHTATGPATLIDETYNASPASVAAAIKVLGLSDKGRRIAVLGDMLELGPDAPGLHAALAKDLANARVDLVFTCGALMQHLHQTLPDSQRGAHAANSVDLAPFLINRLEANDVVLVKGSHSSHMSLIAEALRAL